MKRILLLGLTLALVLNFGLYAQKKEQKKELQNETQNYLTPGKVGLIFFFSGPSAESYITNSDSSTLNAYRQMGIGLTIQITQKFSIEPAVLFSHEKNSTDNNITGNVDNKDKLLYGGEIGLMFTNNLSKSLIYYLGLRSKLLSDFAKRSYSAGTKNETNTLYLGESAVFGLKYFFNDSFAIFGDIELGYYYKKEDYKSWNALGTLTTDTTNKSNIQEIGRSQLGIAIYF